MWHFLQNSDMSVWKWNIPTGFSLNFELYSSFTLNISIEIFHANQDYRSKDTNSFFFIIDAPRLVQPDLLSHNPDGDLMMYSYIHSRSRWSVLDSNSINIKFSDLDPGFTLSITNSFKYSCQYDVYNCGVFLNIFLQKLVKTT